MKTITTIQLRTGAIFPTLRAAREAAIDDAGELFSALLRGLRQA